MVLNETVKEFPIVYATAPAVGRGYITFVNLRPGKTAPGYWVCDECCQRVIPSKFESHAHGRH